MLVILLVFALMRTLRGVPLVSPSEPDDPFPALALRDTQIHFGQRSVNDIIISCLATIFACTWTAAHPNIPAVTDSAWTRFKRRVTITICALVAPELMACWAMNQHIAAKRIRDAYNTDINGLRLDSGQKTPLARFKGSFQAIFLTIYGIFQDAPLPPPWEEGKGPQWTMAHGFFLQMGGFMLCESGRPMQTLIDGSRKNSKNETRLVWNIQQKVIDPPRITEDDIQDRSKGDAIAKTFIVLQTTWFVVQCIARWSQRLPVTELEVVTLGFAILNGITYGLWWDKPQNASRPVFLERRKLWGDTANIANNSTSEDADIELKPLLRQTEPGKETWLRRQLRQEMAEHAHSPSLLWRLPFRTFYALFHPGWKMFDDGTVTKMRVGMFYTAATGGDDAGYATAAIGGLFGAVHLVPSGFLHFSSRQELWLWRVSASITTVEPVLWGLFFYFARRFQGFFEVILPVFGFVGIILYPIPRIILLTLSITTLRSLPPGALQTIQWTTFIPHL